MTIRNELDRRDAELTSEKRKLDARLESIAAELSEIRRLRSVIEGHKGQLESWQNDGKPVLWPTLSRISAVEMALGEMGEALSREEIQRVLWEHGRDDELASISAALSHLKRKGRVVSPSWGLWSGLTTAPLELDSSEVGPDDYEIFISSFA